MRDKHSSKIRFPRPHRKRRIAAPALEWMEDVSQKSVRTTSIGSRRLLVENHRGILAFSETEIKLNTLCGILEIEGVNLLLRDVRPEALVVDGEIHRVDLPCEGGVIDAQ